MPIATIENNVPFQQTNMLDSLYKGQTQRLDVNQREAEAKNLGEDRANQAVDRQQLLEKKRWQRLARKVGAYKTKELWDGNEAALRQIAQEEGIEYQPWGDGTTYDKIMRMGSEMDPQLLDIKEMTAEKASDPKTMTSARIILREHALNPERYASDPGFKSDVNWANLVTTNSQKMVGVPPGGNVHQPPSYLDTLPPSQRPPSQRPPAANGAPKPIFSGAVPEAVINAQAEARQTSKQLGGYINQLENVMTDLDTGDLKLGGWDNTFNWVRNLNVVPGYGSNDPSRAYSSLISALENNRNSLLLLAKGTQTEGDAQRAMTAIANNKTDNILVKKQLGYLINALAAAKEEKEWAANRRDEQYPGWTGGLTADPVKLAPKGFKVERLE